MLSVAAWLSLLLGAVPFGSAASSEPAAAQAASAPAPDDGAIAFVEYVTPSRASELAGIIRRFNGARRGLLILSADFPRGEMPAPIGEGVRVLDLRFNNGVHLVRGNHPRLDGRWFQYGGLATGLGKNLIISDVITNDTPIENFEATASPHASTQFTDEKDYPNAHNHYQNFLSEVWNFSDKVNGVAIWGDSAALVPGARVWGGFLSARSWPLHDPKFVPAGAPAFKDQNFDAALVGLEIDVLNTGLSDGTPSPATGKYLSKIGLQTVGFGKRNTAALELRCVDTDAVKTQNQRDGVWSFGLISNNAIASDGTFIKSAQAQAGVGLDLGQTDFRRGAAVFKTSGPGTGLIFNQSAQGDQGEILVDTTAPTPRTVVRAAVGGLVVLSNDGRRELLSVLPDGKLVVGGQLVRTERAAVGPKTTLLLAGALAAVLALGYAHLLAQVRRLKRAA